jgi:hypothetical protein
MQFGGDVRQRVEHHAAATFRKAAWRRWQVSVSGALMAQSISRGNPVSFFQLKEMANLEVAKRVRGHADN